MSNVSSADVGGCDNYRHLFEQYDWDVPTALAICELESNGVSNAANWNDSHAGCDGSFGLMQIGCLHGHSVSELFDPETNIQVAYHLWQESGWRPWTTYKLLARK